MNISTVRFAGEEKRPLLFRSGIWELDPPPNLMGTQLRTHPETA